MNSSIRWLGILVPVLFGLACSSGPETSPLEFANMEVPDVADQKPEPPPAAQPIFPEPEALESQIAFWRKVYALWKRSQVVLHDDRYLNVVYEIADLPGETAESYTPAQKAFIKERQDFWRQRLRERESSPTPVQEIDRTVAIPDFVPPDACHHVRAQRGLRERFKRGIEISGRYDRVFRRIFRRAGLPEDLAFLPHVESSFQGTARSSAGAVGIWQFTRSAAKAYMDLDMMGDERLDPIASARGAARYLSAAYSKLGSWPLALTSYNHGIGGMQRAKEQFGEDFVRIVREYDHPKFGFASRNFYAEFLAAREIAANPERYFPEGIRYEEALVAEQPVPGLEASAFSSAD